MLLKIKTKSCHAIGPKYEVYSHAGITANHLLVIIPTFRRKEIRKYFNYLFSFKKLMLFSKYITKQFNAIFL